MIILTTLSIMLMLAQVLPVSVSSEWIGNDRLGQKARLVEKGDVSWARR